VISPLENQSNDKSDSFACINQGFVKTNLDALTLANHTGCDRGSGTDFFRQKAALRLEVEENTFRQRRHMIFAKIVVPDLQW